MYVCMHACMNASMYVCIYVDRAQCNNNYEKRVCTSVNIYIDMCTHTYTEHICRGFMA